MDTLKLMTVFVAVADEKGFAGGARKLGMSPPAVTRAIATLEARLGVKLLERTTRAIQVTSAGEHYLKDSRRIIEEVNEANETAAGINAAPKGTLAVTAPVLFGKLYILPCIIQYMKQYPAMDITAIFLDRPVNLLEEGFDVGIRMGNLPDSSIKALPVGNIRQVTCSSPSYLEKHGIPLTPSDLSDHNIISTNDSGLTEWKFKQKSKIITIRVKPRLVLVSNDDALEAVMQGSGIAKLPFQALHFIESGKLKMILEEFEPAPRPVHIVHHEGRYVTAKIRSFIDFIAKRLRKNSDLN